MLKVIGQSVSLAHMVTAEARTHAHIRSKRHPGKLRLLVPSDADENGARCDRGDARDGNVAHHLLPSVFTCERGGQELKPVMRGERERKCVRGDQERLRGSALVCMREQKRVPRCGRAHALMRSGFL